MPHDGRSGTLGVFGGTFDPPHNGHVSVASRLLESGALDEIVWIPARQSPHKQTNPLASSEHRLEMTRAAIQGRAHQSVSDIECSREGPSYTVETLRALKSERPEAKLVLIMGSDQFAELANWREADEIVRLAEVCVWARGGVELAAVQPSLNVTWRAANVPPVDVSSTEVRDRVREGRPYRHLVPGSVADIIERDGLYKAPIGTGHL